MRYALLDSSIYIGFWERGLYAPDLDEIRRKFIVRQSSVVLSELHRGAKSKRALELVKDLYGLAKQCWTPDREDWWTAGEVLRLVSLKKGWEGRKIRDLQNDVLIALTARRHGATIVTANRGDFEDLYHYIRFSAVFI